MKFFFSLLSGALLLFGCSNESSLDPNDYEQSMEYLMDNFEISYERESTLTPEYLEGYDIREISNNIRMSLNASGQIVALQFNRLTTEELESLLEEVNVNFDEELELLLLNIDDFENEHNRSYYINELDDIGVHILAQNSAMLEKMNTDTPYSLNLFYNLNIYKDFISE